MSEQSPAPANVTGLPQLRVACVAIAVPKAPVPPVMMTCFPASGDGDGFGDGVGDGDGATRGEEKAAAEVKVDCEKESSLDDAARAAMKRWRRRALTTRGASVGR